MSIHFQHTIVLPQSTRTVFATLDDFSVTPKWLERCTSIEKLEPGPNAVGQTLRYAYRDGRRSGVMKGRITIHEPDQQIAMAYADKMMQVTVDFWMEPEVGATRLTHSVTLTPKTFLGRLLSPLIRRQVLKQTVAAMEKLRVYLALTNPALSPAKAKNNGLEA